MAPANLGGASGIVSYKATCGAQNTSGAASPLVVTGLTNGTSYTCSVTANNGVGDSASGQATATIPFPAVSYQFTQASTGGPLGTSGTFTITPNAAEGTVVSGFIAVDTFNKATSSGDELINIPYRYTVG